LLPTLDIGSHINAAPQLLPEAGAERTLEAVGWTPWLGASAAAPPHMRKEQGQRERFVLSWRATRGSSWPSPPWCCVPVG